MLLPVTKLALSNYYNKADGIRLKQHRLLLDRYPFLP